MFDVVRLQLQAGNGGHGRVSFLREKFRPKGGPDGGNGGDGGSIYIKGSRHINTLQSFAGVKEYAAPAGGVGGAQNCEGQKGDDLILEVPIGTTIWLLAENEIGRVRRLHQASEGNVQPKITHLQFALERPSGGMPPLPPKDEMHVITPADTNGEGALIDESIILRSDSLKNVRLKDIPKIQVIEIMDEEPFLLCQGGEGGRGNDTFKSSLNVTPLQAEFGTFGEKKVILFELKLLADVGLVGYPNAGKSTLLSIVTRANPKIANYPFTTLEPNLGVMSIENENGSARDLVIADIPGLIEGASDGKGLGYDFLRHVQACKILLYVLTLEENQVFDTELSDDQKAELLFEQYQVLKGELSNYDQSLVEKPALLSLSKEDLYSAELIQSIQTYFQAKRLKILSFSAVTKQHIDVLKHALQSALPQN